ncbi:MAG TPA: DNA methyltransferase [Acidobacteria bacterium]|nr:DNA methyltransferase [Acidobacteriota bacterium]
MIPKNCKRLAEVDFPIAEVSKHAAREKSIRYGHPSTLHLWWARRPLASSRAMLLGLLWPDPCEPLCPEEFKRAARELLPTVQGTVGPTDEDLRKALLRFIGDFANWDRATTASYLDVSRALVKAAHGAEPPLVVDPFSGGGSIPLEAQRLGGETFASDLNPVSCLILKVMLEDIPRSGPKFADELRRVGSKIKQKVEMELTDLYPKDPDGALPIAYLWARTVRCESPNCDAEIPLVRSFWLSKKANRRRALKPRVSQLGGAAIQVNFDVVEPKSDKDITSGTVRNAKATCLACGAVLPPERVRAQLLAQRGGADCAFDARGHRIGGARLLAVVTQHQDHEGRHYRRPTERDYAAVRKAHDCLEEILADWSRSGQKGLCPVPDEPTPQDGSGSVGGGFRTRKYGIHRFGDFFTCRQKLVLVLLIRAVRSIETDESARRIAGLALSRLTDIYNAFGVWETTKTQVRNLFSRQAIGMRWDFAEANASAEQAGDYLVTLETMCRVVERLASLDATAQVEAADATQHPLPDETADIWFTDPPYYDSVPYADLSDFFYVWLKRALSGYPVFKNHRDNLLTPKAEEAVRDEQIHLDGRPKKTAEWYEKKMHQAFMEGRRVLKPDGIGSVVFAHKTTEGWESLLSGIIRGGWTITGSWPIVTEMATRLRARESAALATSVHLVCRPRSDEAPIGDWAAVLRDLPIHVGDWMERLQAEGIRGADLVFACIGPALEIFSRYSKVEAADGRGIALAEYLEKVWEAVGRSALGQVLGTAEARARNGAAGAVEEDARLTALFLWTLQSTTGEDANVASEEDEEEEPTDDEDEESSPRGTAKGYTLVYDVVRRFAQPLGIDLPKWDRRVIEIKKGVVHLLPIAERAKQLFGEEGAQAVAMRLESHATARDPFQGLLFPEMQPGAGSSRGPARARGGRAGAEVSEESLQAAPEATTLDRVHVAMLLQAGGRSNALRALLSSEQELGPDFLRLANALSALYPKGSEEKRLLDAMLLAVPR